MLAPAAPESRLLYNYPSVPAVDQIIRSPEAQIHLKINVNLRDTFLLKKRGPDRFPSERNRKPLRKHVPSSNRLDWASSTKRNTTTTRRPLIPQLYIRKPPRATTSQKIKRVTFFCRLRLCQVQCAGRQRTSPFSGKTDHQRNPAREKPFSRRPDVRKTQRTRAGRFRKNSRKNRRFGAIDDDRRPSLDAADAYGFWYRFKKFIYFSFSILHTLDRYVPEVLGINTWQTLPLTPMYELTARTQQ